MPVESYPFPGVNFLSLIAIVTNDEPHYFTILLFYQNSQIILININQHMQVHCLVRHKHDSDNYSIT